MRFRLPHRCGEEGIPRPTSLQGFLASARAAILPGRIDWPAVDRMKGHGGAAGPYSLRPLHSSNATSSPRMTCASFAPMTGSPSVVNTKVARLMRENALQARQRRRFKRTTETQPARLSGRTKPLKSKTSKRNGAETRNGVPTSPMSGHARAGSTSARSSLTSLPGAVVGWAAGDRLPKGTDVVGPYARRPSPCRCPSAGAHSPRGPWQPILLRRVPGWS